MIYIQLDTAMHTLEVILLDLIFSAHSSVPLYEQLESQLKAAILKGELKQGALLPSIRAMARDLQVSIITVKRAYDDLESEGFLETTPGKGTYVAVRNTERLREAALAQLEEKLNALVSEARALGLRQDQFSEIAKTLFELQEQGR